jgi:hypothetical protein
MNKIAQHPKFGVEPHPVTNLQQSLVGLRQAIEGIWRFAPVLDAAQQYDTGVADTRPPRPIAAHDQITRHKASLAAMLNRNI